MSGFTAKSFESPDETRTPDKTRVEVLELGGIKAARRTTAPEWKWRVIADQPAIAFEFDSSTAQTFAKRT